MAQLSESVFKFAPKSLYRLIQYVDLQKKLLSKLGLFSSLEKIVNIYVTV